MGILDFLKGRTKATQQNSGCSGTDAIITASEPFKAASGKTEPAGPVRIVTCTFCKNGVSQGSIVKETGQTIICGQCMKVCMDVLDAALPKNENGVRKGIKSGGNGTCSFCGASTYKRLIAGGPDTAICDMCIDSDSIPGDLKGQVLGVGNGNTGGHAPVPFLGSLVLIDKLRISNQHPLIYLHVLNEKQSGKRQDISIMITEPQHPLEGQQAECVVEILRGLSMDEVKKLHESATAASRADGLRDDDTEKLRFYRQAFELNPYNDLAMMSYGCVLGIQGDIREGIKWVEKALEVNPENMRARNNLAAMKSMVKEQSVRFTTDISKRTVGGNYLCPGINKDKVTHDTKPDGTHYEVWEGKGKTSALVFLRQIPFNEIPSLYYVIVETPEGAFGKDINGMFNETTGEGIL